MELHRRTGVRIVLDVHHHRIHQSSADISPIGRWPLQRRHGGRRDREVHLSSARTMLERGDPAAPQGTPPRYPPLRRHADLVLPWDLEAVVRAVPVPLDVMLEAKAKDLAVIQVRKLTVEVRPAIAALEERPG